MFLSTFQNSGFNRGASRAKELAWIIVSELLVSGPLPGSRWRTTLLRAFRAKIGPGVIFKPRVRIKFPWRLEVGRNSWIGENVWIDNLAFVRIGHDVCISQGAYICTGNHDWNSPSFDLMTAGVTIEDHCWVGARATVAPGMHMHEGSILGLASIGQGQLEGWTIYASGKTLKIGSRCRDQILGEA